MTTTRRCDDVDASSANEAESQHSSTAGSASMKHKEGKFRSRRHRHRHRRCSAVDVRVVTNTCIRAHKHACMMNELYACVCVCVRSMRFFLVGFSLWKISQVDTRKHTHTHAKQRNVYDFSDNFKVEV